MSAAYFDWMLCLIVFLIILIGLTGKLNFLMDKRAGADPPPKEISPNDLEGFARAWRRRVRMAWLLPHGLALLAIAVAVGLLLVYVGKQAPLVVAPWALASVPLYYLLPLVKMLIWRCPRCSRFLGKHTPGVRSFADWGFTRPARCQTCKITYP